MRVCTTDDFCSFNGGHPAGPPFTPGDAHVQKRMSEAQSADPGSALIEHFALKADRSVRVKAEFTAGE